MLLLTALTLLFPSPQAYAAGQKPAEAKNALYVGNMLKGSWPPFVMAQDGKFVGISFGIVQAAAASFGYELQSQDAGQDNLGGIKLVAAEKRKAMCTGPIAAEWVSEEFKSKAVLTEPIIETRDRVWFALGKLPAGKQKLAELEPGTKIGACKDYSYPTLGPLFSSGSLVRVDFERTEKDPCELAVAKAVLEGKVAGGVANEHVLGYLIKQGRMPANQVEAFPQDEGKVSLRMLCAKNAASDDFVKKLNAKMESLQKSSTIQRIVEKYCQL